MRLNQYLAQSGQGSRRAVERLILDGAVSVNGRIVRELATTVEPDRDRVEVSGQGVHPAAQHQYILMHKPRGYDVTRGDRHAHRRAYDLLPKHTHPSVQAVGRLDRDSTGLLLFTNDGALAFRLAHPSHGCEKIYEVEIEGAVDQAIARRLTEGVELEDGPARAVRAEVLPVEDPEAGGRLRIVMAEGRKRIVRRMLEALGRPVVRLQRSGFGPLRLTDLRTGKTRPLTQFEVRLLYKSVGLRAPAPPRPPAPPRSRRPHGAR